MLLSAYATERIGIHAIFGAFLFGAMLPKRTGMVRELTDKVEDFTVIVLLPVFFLVTGLRTDIFTIDSVSLVFWLLLVLAVAVGGKFFGCGMAARLTGFSWQDSTVIGALMNTRGLTELVILTIGLQLGVLSDSIFAIMVIMALATTVMAAPIVNRLMPREKALQEMTDAERGAPLPAATRVLVAVTNPLTAPGLVDVATRLTGRLRPAELLLVRLLRTPRSPEIRTGLLDEDMQMGEVVESMDGLVAQAAGGGVAARPLSFMSDDFVADLANLGRDQRCDLVLIAAEPALSPQYDSNRNTIRRLLARVPTDVGVVLGVEDRLTEEGPVLVAVAPGESEEAAAAAGLRLAEGLQTGVKMIGFGGEADAATASRRVALLADRLAEESGIKVVADFRADAAAAVSEETAASRITVVPAGDDYQQLPDFGEPANTLLRQVKGPAMVVRSGAAVEARQRAAADWPFISPAGAPDGRPAMALPGGPHLQRLDAWGRAVELDAVDEGISIGRLPEHQLTLLDDNLVSRTHAAVERRNGGFVLKDLGSTNGTMLWRDGKWQDIAEEELRNGDLIVIGENVFRFGLGEAATATE